MKIAKGKKASPAKVVIYGHEGVGKSTLASKFPSPLFLDIEGSTSRMDVARIDEPCDSLDAFSSIMRDLIASWPEEYKTLVIDTGDWLDQLVCNKVFGTNTQPTQVNDFGRSYVVLENTWAKILDQLTLLQSRQQVNVVITAHATLRTVTNPETVGSYDHWEMKCSKKGAAKLKEWSDFLLFLNFKVTVQKDGMRDKAQGGQRCVITSHTAWADAKSRESLPNEIILTPNGAGERQLLAAIFSNAPERLPSHDNHPSPDAQQPVLREPEAVEEKPDFVCRRESLADEEPEEDDHSNSPRDLGAKPMTADKETLMVKLQSLMSLSGYSMADLELATAHPRISMRPKGTPLRNFSEDDLQRLVNGWDRVSATIEKCKGEKR